jgi:hypothetical protein
VNSLWTTSTSPAPVFLNLPTWRTIGGSPRPSPLPAILEPLLDLPHSLARDTPPTSACRVLKKGSMFNGTSSQEELKANQPQVRIHISVVS